MRGSGGRALEAGVWAGGAAGAVDVFVHIHVLNVRKMHLCVAKYGDKCGAGGVGKVWPASHLEARTAIFVAFVLLFYFIIHFKRLK